MRKIMRKTLICFVCVVLFVFNGTFSFAADNENLQISIDETKKLLQKSLTILQLDQEIARLSVQEVKVSEKIADTQLKIIQQNEQLADTRKHAGKILRAYYMGDRDQVWMLLLTTKSFSQAIAVFEYMVMIYQNDHTILNKYAASFKTLQETERQLVATQAELKQVKDDFIAQRDRAIALQKEVDERISQIPQDQAQLILSKIEELKTVWNEKVIPLFESYFNGISIAMKSLPEILTGNNQDKYLNLKTLSFQITDQDLTQFFHEKNKQLENMTFRFANGQYTASGHNNDIDAAIKGHYTVESNPNRLQFHIDELTYNDNILDPSMNRTMEERFDLSFSPEKYSPFPITVTDVTTNDGILTIKFKLKTK